MRKALYILALAWLLAACSSEPVNPTKTMPHWQYSRTGTRASFPARAAYREALGVEYWIRSNFSRAKNRRISSMAFTPDRLTPRFMAMG